MTARLKDPPNYSFGDQKIPEASSFKYSGIIACRVLSWADAVIYTAQKAWKALHVIMYILKNENSNMTSLAYTSIVNMILEYGDAWDPYWEGQVITLAQVQKIEAKFANHRNESVWETMAQHRKIGRKCALFKMYTGELAWKASEHRLLGTCYLNRKDWKVMGRTQRTDIGKHSI